MKIIIAGDGKVGATLTEKLSGEGHSVTIIDNDSDVIENLVDMYDVLAVNGNCASMDILEQADVTNADLLIAATSSDEVNMVCCITAHSLNPFIHTIARIRNPEYNSQVARMKDKFGMSLIFNPERQAATEIERLIKFPGFLQRDTFAKGRAEIVELRISADSKLNNVAIKDLMSVIKCKVLICIVTREGVAYAPDGDFILEEGDRIFVTAPTNSLTELLNNLNIITHRARRVIVCGAGKISYYLAERLMRSGIKVQVIEKDLAKCEELAARLPKAIVVHGDASDQKLLESEGVDSCDALVTLTGFDELNMVISLYGNSQKIPQIITKIDRVGNTQMLDVLPIGSTICPKQICSESIVTYVRAMQNQKGAALTIHSIADGQAEALEFRVDENTEYCGVPLKQLRIKKGVLLACITRGTQTVIPNGDSSYSPGDTLIIITTKENVISQIDDIFD